MQSSIVVSLSLVALTATPAARLGLDHQPFLEDFRAAEGRARLVTVLSPT
jgi:hypothetical protein